MTDMHRSMSFVLATALASKDNQTVQGQQLQLSPYQARSNVPMFGIHGLVSRPLPGAHVVALCQGGDPSNVIGIAVNDPRYYRQGLPDGTVGLAHHLGAHVLLFADRIEVDGGGRPVLIKNASKVRVEGNLEVTGEVTAMCDGASVTLSQHKHPTAAIGAPSKPTPGT